MAIAAKFSKSAEAKAAGWFSRRHQTAGALYAERQQREEKAAADAVARENRAAIRAIRSPIQQLAWLDAHGYAAKRERARLLRRIREAA